MEQKMITLRKTSPPPLDESMPDLKEYMTTQEAAEKLGFHVKSIPKMVRDNILEGVRFGRFWLVARKSVDEYLNKTRGMRKTDPRRKRQK
jgi:excisionase family DNA binding protein